MKDSWIKAKTLYHPEIPDKIHTVLKTDKLIAKALSFRIKGNNSIEQNNSDLDESMNIGISLEPAGGLYGRDLDMNELINRNNDDIIKGSEIIGTRKQIENSKRSKSSRKKSR